MNTIDEAIAILRAMKEGEDIQVELCDGFQDRDNPDKLPNFYDHKYRIKPKPRVFWANVYPGQVSSYLYQTKRGAEVYCGESGETIKVVEAIE